MSYDLLASVAWLRGTYFIGLFVTLQISWWLITAHLDVALSTNSYNGVTISRQTALHCSSEEIWKCHFLWKWEWLVLPRASTVKPLSSSYHTFPSSDIRQSQSSIKRNISISPSSLLVKKHLYMCVCVRESKIKERVRNNKVNGGDH